jgi:signal transduction histidine kinase
MLRRKLLGPVLVLLGVMIVALAGAGWESTIQVRALQRRVDEIQRTNALTVRLFQLQADCQRAILSYGMRRDPEFLQAMRNAQEESQRVIADLDTVPLPPRGARLWSQTREALGIRSAQLARFAEAIDSGNAQEVNTAFERWERARVLGAALLGDFETYDLKLLDRTIASLEARRSRSALLFSLALLVSVGIAVAFAWWVERGVVRPIAALTAATELIPEGRLALGEQERRSDEIGVLARAFARMTDTLLATNARLSAAVRTRDEFISIASHELRTPLATLKLQLQLLPRRLAEAGLLREQPRWVETAQRQVLRLERLVNDLLDVTRIAAGRLELRTEQVDLSALVVAAAERFSPDVGQGPRLEITPGVRGRWDPDRLDQVVANLLSNAIRHAPGAPVSLALCAVDGHAILTVRDGGPGIPPDRLDRIFERFERGRDPRTAGGLGLGLYITRQIVESHGGTIRAESAPGAGATFVVRLPGVETEGVAAPSDGAERA